ncbi:hypothetical protein ABZ863_12960 [Saccharomonospora sp. NPDC046836]|uniref:hypothetical protein n=1 Tax=Saccharomonospora sp. NPDC046836 TaxID=3156921 RepID=UPI0033CDFDE0
MTDNLRRYVAQSQGPHRWDGTAGHTDASTVCAQAERAIAYFGNRLGVEYRTRIESALREVRGALMNHDLRLAGQRAEVLKTVLQEAGGVQNA